jgi:hypothetical protein
MRVYLDKKINNLDAIENKFKLLNHKAFTKLTEYKEQYLERLSFLLKLVLPEVVFWTKKSNICLFRLIK